ncbi:uncharacterized protein LOC108252999 isoform X2 [Diaphorina citri]|uniref:Uncharacterized protein LOC108252999 isoform X2 n=1 Tax=Diaphorina citri TaxID=121845 RepID=A0A1S4EHF7_DIACI|nr:uncharacterized protein LOC108252999 isoform X2 [Diaphorina citri]
MLGVEVIHVYKSFGLDVAKINMQSVMDRFDGYFSPKKNTSLEKSKFLFQRQKVGESLESFFTRLKNAASTCELGALEESLVKDILILGLLNEYSYIKERLLEEGDKKSA